MFPAVERGGKRKGKEDSDLKIILQGQNDKWDFDLP